MDGNATLKTIKKKVRRYICHVRPLSAEERETLKQKIILELSKIQKQAGCMNQ